LLIGFEDLFRVYLSLIKRTGNFSLRKNLKFILLLLFAIFLFWFFGRNLDWQQVIDSLGKARAVYIVSAVLIICLGYLLRAKRWQVLLEPITETSLKELFATTTVGFAAVFFIGRTGEIVRPMWLPMRDKRVRPSAALVTLVVERIFDLAALICFFSLNLLWFSSPEGRETEFAFVQTIGYLLLIGVAVGFICLIIYQRTSPKIIAWTEKFTDRSFIPRRIREIIISILKQLAKALEILRDWREVMAVTFWTLMLWLAIAVPTWLVLVAFDLPLTFSAALFVMGWAAIGSIVPTPGGAAGAFHVATANGLIFLNVEQELAMAVSIAMHLVYFAPAVIFGLYYFLRGDINISGLRNLLSKNEEDESDSSNFESRELGSES